MLTTSAFRHLFHVLAATQNPAHRTMSEVNENPDLSKGEHLLFLPLNEITGESASAGRKSAFLVALFTHGFGEQALNSEKMIAALDSLESWDHLNLAITAINASIVSIELTSSPDQGGIFPEMVKAALTSLREPLGQRSHALDFPPTP